MLARCSGCGAPRLPMARCPECGAPYPAAAPDAGAVWDGAAQEARRERRLRAWAPPLALAFMFLVARSDLGRGVQRIFAGMWLHELGHALTGWLCGFPAIPGPWRTAIADDRSPLVTVALLLVLAAGVALSWRAGRRRLAAILAAIALIACGLTVGLGRDRAHALILFAGDGGAMVLGALLVASFWAGPGSHLHRTWLRWGFLVLGAAGLADPFSMWWRARHDLEVIDFGEIDGVGDSDPTRLVDAHGWSIHDLVARNVTVGVVALLALAVGYVVALLPRRPT